MSAVTLKRELNVAKRLLLRSQAASELPDIIAHADLHHQWAEIRDTIDAELQSGKCGPLNTEILEYPKGAIDVRPLSRFSVRDHLVYDALVYRIASKIDSNISQNVYSYRWRSKVSELGFPVTSWLRMRMHSIRVIKRDSSLRIAATDVSSFYEHVDIDTLNDDLYAVTPDVWTLKRLGNFLSNFQDINHAWGLPQGSDASGILANLYLAPVDEYLSKNGLRFVRYSDDMMIFHSDWNALRDALAGVNRILRSRRLSSSGSKTRIWEPEQAKKLLDDTYKTALAYNIDIAAPGSKEELRRYFNDTIDRDSLDMRDLKFALNRFRRSRDNYAVQWCLENLRFVANLAREIFNYFESLYESSLYIAKGLCDFMEEEDSRSYPYLEQRIIRYFITVGIRDDVMLERAWSILQDRNRVRFPREFAARYIGNHASLSESQLLLHKFEEEPDGDMRRALLVALYDANYCSPRLLKRVEGAFPELRWICAYLLDSPQLPLTGKAVSWR
ncbi:RNA-directed DNA polymerase [Streptomyces somaliensis DSM 40738]|uniref:RNA-directed DNA polymerase n=1 Tax=Streptomyces somaliensis (strain ATCC 33201 / DSM 40738 / JCM 12659 / KCTC 9044 / NCTC 11332 / NRRL B-12077 / IP 733) TaxID=1134445 RepID=A0AA44DBK4_STRE0|nr:RNA-directed DNA polymerase [Streptomyces somaliensis]MCQ0023155.1 RNA-directed DNA polymerase [Streptomyces somaliensis DSM 40738]NKY13241.1 RNA-directed DNA polymerase [Streptomyces somaliensis DSM 40738]